MTWLKSKAHNLRLAGKRALRGALSLLARLSPSTNELLLLAGVALITRGLYVVWAPSAWLYPGLWFTLWGLGRMLPPQKGGGD